MRPLALGDILDGAFRSIRFAPSVMFGLTAIVVVIASAAQVLPIYFTSAAGSGLTADYALNTLLSTGIGQILSFLATTILSGMLTYAVAQGAIGKRVTIATAWRAIGGRVPKLIGLTLLTALIIVGAVIVPVGLMLGGAVLMDTGGFDDRIGTGIGLILLGLAGMMVAAFWVAIRLLLAPAALVLEDQSITGALKRSWQLSHKRFWRLLGIYLLTSLIVGMAAGIVSTPVSAIAAFALADNLVLVAGATALAGAIASLITTPFAAAVVALLYIDARIRSEGLDLALMGAAEA